MSQIIPFLLGHGAWCATRAAAAPAHVDAPLQVLDVLDPATLPFFHLVNAGNAVAYGGAAMPAWVQLDCACLPAGMVGFGAPRSGVDPALWARLAHEVERAFGADARAAVERWTGLVPLSEYTCVHTPTAGEVVGFSLYSLRRGLGLRTKALALLVAEAARQTGIAQVDNSSLRTHTAIGPLEVIAAPVVAHSRPDTTFVYRLHIEDRVALRALAEGGAPGARRHGSVRLAIDAGTTRSMAELIRAQGPHAVVDALDGALSLVPWR